MKWMFLVFAAAAQISMAHADEYVNGYTRSNGTYVEPHYRSSPNNTTYDNWSTKGNVNPYTGQEGTRNPYGSSSNSSYGLYGSGPSSFGSNRRW